MSHDGNKLNMALFSHKMYSGTAAEERTGIGESYFPNRLDFETITQLTQYLL